MATIDRQATTLALAHALSAAERGLSVIPLSRTKLPALRSPHRDDPTAPLCHGECGRFGHGVYDASIDPIRIRELFAAAPWATGYGIACGLDPH
ncbi:bifunctional DNA primase/polymerase, partial [Streptomyces sp. NPDC047868]